MRRFKRRPGVISALLALLLCASFVAVAHHHHGLAQPDPAPSAETEQGASGSGRLCHACILGGTPMMAASTVVVTRPEATGPSDVPERPSSSIRGGYCDGTGSRAPPLPV